MADPATAPDGTALLRSLTAQRRHVLGILEGLPEEALRRRVLPSGWTCLGLVRHLALDVERFWFRAVLAGEPVDLEEGDGAWQVPAEMAAEDVFELYRRETEAADAVLATTPLDAGPRWWPEDLFEGMPPMDLQRTILHVIAETACHAGHLDAARELIDGRQHFVLT